jgi:uncharacterized membrane protein YgaE (UPF0421/DUF939 family)
MNIWKWLGNKLKEEDETSIDSRLKALESSHASEEELEDMQADRDHWRDKCATERIETEMWKMRADNKTDQYRYWLNIASLTHNLSEQSVVSLNRQAQSDRSSLTSKVDEIEKRMEDQAQEIEGLRIDFKGLEERTDKEIQFCLKDIQTLSMKEKQ